MQDNLHKLKVLAADLRKEETINSAELWRRLGALSARRGAVRHETHGTGERATAR